MIIDPVPAPKATVPRYDFQVTMLDAIRGGTTMSLRVEMDELIASFSKKS